MEVRWSFDGASMEFRRDWAFFAPPPLPVPQRRLPLPGTIARPLHPTHPTPEYGTFTIKACACQSESCGISQWPLTRRGVEGVSCGPMTSAEIRQSFLDFFKSKGHTIVPSSSLMPDSPEPAVHQRRHEPVRADLPRPARPRRLQVGRRHPRQRHPRRRHPEVHPRRRQTQRPRRRRPRHLPPHLLRDAGELVLRRLLQAGGHRVGLGTRH